MSQQTSSITFRDDSSFPYIYEQNVDIPLRTYKTGVIRANIHRPHDTESGVKYPVIVTYGPYGKDIAYSDFRKPSADERGIGQSPGLLDTMSQGTSDAFFDVVEWAAVQKWSTGKVGLLGISYYAGTQWRVAARNPKGLAAIIPWEGMSDYYRDRCRHGGILSNNFIDIWWRGQVVVNQYGRPRSNPKIPPTIEGTLPEEELQRNLRDQRVDNVEHKYLDEEYYASRDYCLEDIKVPLLSVANWGGILLHLRGNVEGYFHAGSETKYLHFITGRHDLPFYYRENAALQKSFLDAFLKGEDNRGWSTPGKIPPVSILLREGDVGFNDVYTRYYLLPDGAMTDRPSTAALHCSLRKVDTAHAYHRDYLPYRSYASTSVEPLVPGEVYKVTVEIWPTNVVVSPGNRLVFEIAGADTQGSGIFTHDHPKDRDERVFGGRNEIRFGVDLGNYVTMPVISSASG
ncbi:hydrolase, CocE/NonD family [Aspergillus niger CBS 101883]|uniref:hydrolase, CocE/NonD family n=1 Tax=Aspergillus lacticoffeatus (strain CBS 101883) TaxID=1450533 RepID=UPI000D7EC502|nr:hydrolase, CocE/NonD family [Aspergillus niger CBS 101883]PYH53081.1 hydrolase, CocE/NonD family [Aspergillus niger CBS 101883]